MSDRQATSAFVLLGLLTSRDWSAYELAEQVGRGVDQVWPRAARQRYNTLKKLVDEGWVTARTEATGNRERSVYSITESGHAAITAWLEGEPNPPTMEFEGLVRLLLADQGTVENLRATLETTIAQSREALDLFASHAAMITATGGTFPERQHLFGLANRYMIGHHTHTIEWATWALKEIESWNDTTSAVTDREATIARFQPGLDLL